MAIYLRNEPFFNLASPIETYALKQKNLFKCTFL